MKIAVWPTGEWCWQNDIECYMRDANLSDDFAAFTVDSADTAERIAGNIEAGRPPLSS